MIGDFEQNQGWAKRLFLGQVAPHLLSHLSGTIHAIEGDDHPICQLLDRTGGLDYLHKSPCGLLRGIANRVQSGDRNWATFTIRKKRMSGARTEYEKRTAAIAANALYPFFTVHSYFDYHDRLLGYAVARTDQIFQAIRQGRCSERQTGSCQIGQATFLYVSWRDLILGGTPIIMYDQTKGVTIIRSKKGVKEYQDNLTDEELNEGFSHTIDGVSADGVLIDGVLIDGVSAEGEDE